MAVKAGLLLSAAVWMAGCGSGGSGNSSGADNPATTTDTTPPSIVQANVVYPSTFSFDGGAVTVHAVVTDESGVASVSAVVTPPANVDKPVQTITLQYVAGSAGDFEAQYETKGNGNSANQNDNYTVVVTATDTKGNSRSSSPFTITVPPPDAPPAINY